MMVIVPDDVECAGGIHLDRKRRDFGAERRDVEKLLPARGMDALVAGAAVPQPAEVIAAQPAVIPLNPNRVGINRRLLDPVGLRPDAEVGSARQLPFGHRFDRAHVA